MYLAVTAVKVREEAVKLKGNLNSFWDTSCSEALTASLTWARKPEAVAKSVAVSSTSFKRLSVSLTNVIKVVAISYPKLR